MNSLPAEAIVFSEPGRVAVRECQVRAPGPGEILIHTAFSCISPGTELRKLRGRECVGVVPYPLVPGYCLSGRVAARGAGVTLREGTPVISCGTIDAGGLALAEGGHISRVTTLASLAVEVPEPVDLLEASAAILAGIAWHGLLMSRPKPGERVAVVGLGLIGQAAALVHAAAGAEVVGCDRSRRRVEMARRAGLTAVEAADGLRNAFAPIFPGGADIVVDATGAPQATPEAMALLHAAPWDPLRDSPGARYLVQGSFESSFPVPYPAAYAAQASILIPRGSQVSDWRAAVELLAAGRLRLREIIGAVRPPEAAAETYSELASPDSGVATVAFDWRGR
jgi:2-desacetyl-2-hydroxyethyl bacteriochlorophyllide A dehydrogenase